MVSGDMMTDAREGGTSSHGMDQKIEAAVQRTLDDIEEHGKGTKPSSSPGTLTQERHTVASMRALPASALDDATTRR
jgi:hypothetical protein